MLWFSWSRACILYVHYFVSPSISEQLSFLIQYTFFKLQISCDRQLLSGFQGSFIACVLWMLCLVQQVRFNLLSYSVAFVQLSFDSSFYVWLDRRVFIRTWFCWSVWRKLKVRPLSPCSIEDYTSVLYIETFCSCSGGRLPPPVFGFQVFDTPTDVVFLNMFGTKKNCTQRM